VRAERASAPGPAREEAEQDGLAAGARESVPSPAADQSLPDADARDAAGQAPAAAVRPAAEPPAAESPGPAPSPVVTAPQSANARRLGFAESAAGGAPAEAADFDAAGEPGQAAFDRLASPRDDEAKLAADGIAGARGAETGRAPRRTQASSAAPSDTGTSAEAAAPFEAAVPEAAVLDAADEASRPAPTAAPIGAFATELEPFQLGLLRTGHLVVFRNAWRDGRRFVQGALIDQARFLDGAVASVFGASPLVRVGRLGISIDDRELLALGPLGDADTLLYRARLSPPFADLELEFRAGDLPPGPAHSVLVWTSVALATVLGLGFVIVYRVGLAQIRLVRQQQDFVSAVSHELKTPLTSIRMYGEMLLSGWASEDKRRTYYEFIYAESERLSRLIDNVLRLARLGRDGERAKRGVTLAPAAVSELIDMLRSKLATQVERAGLGLGVDVDEAAAAAVVAVDADAFAQVFINLVDNALKFAAAAERRDVVLGARRAGSDEVVFWVRDFGPGVPREALKRLFELFYRPDNDLSRGVPGTGIGLALVRELVTAMNGKVDVLNREPGAEFRITLRVVSRRAEQ
jgi:signal transduction histidine kinase